VPRGPNCRKVNLGAKKPGKNAPIAQTGRRPRLRITRTMSSPPKPASAKLEG
jgi:hypothetical protein